MDVIFRRFWAHLGFFHSRQKPTIPESIWAHMGRLKCCLEFFSGPYFRLSGPIALEQNLFGGPFKTYLGQIGFLVLL